MPNFPQPVHEHAGKTLAAGRTPRGVWRGERGSGVQPMVALANGAVAHGHDLDDSAPRIRPRFPRIGGGTNARSRLPRWISKLSTM